jgi:ABC-type microcin C transport system permease subunit YejE
MLKISVENPEKKRPLGVDGRIILKRLIYKYYRRVWTGLMWTKIGSVVGLL